MNARILWGGVALGTGIIAGAVYLTRRLTCHSNRVKGALCISAMTRQHGLEQGV